MNLDSIPGNIWRQLALCARQAVVNKQPVRGIVGEVFYSHIYEHYSDDRVGYEDNVEGAADLGWDDFIGIWKDAADSHQPLAQALAAPAAKVAANAPAKAAPIGVPANAPKVPRPVAVAHGYGSVQADDPNDPKSRMRPFEVYNNVRVGDRFQFVVETGGGLVLFNRMHRACQLYIEEQCMGKPEICEVHAWKVFSEAFGKGRSDSCVVYLGCEYTSPRVATLVEFYIWKHVQDLVDAKFKPLGFYSIADLPIWAMPLPLEQRELQVLGQRCHGSAGALMSSILGLAFERARPTADVNEWKLAEQAKLEAIKINDSLFALPH